MARGGYPVPVRTPYPPLSDYALIADCHAAALVSRAGSVDWCCMPRLDRGSCFGRLLDWDSGGHCSLAPAGRVEAVGREYLDRTLILSTTFQTAGGELRVHDCFVMRRGRRNARHRELLRVAEVTRGAVEVEVVVAPRFDYGAIRPWLKRAGHNVHCAIGGDDGLLITGDVALEAQDGFVLAGRAELRAGERTRLSIVAMAPETIEESAPEAPEPDALDRRLDATARWWRSWSRRARFDGPDEAAVMRSALVLKALTHEPTGAIAAAATTSLPEVQGGGRNWDYRFSWVRDSTWAVRALADLGYESQANGFRRFVERSSAGSAEDLQILYGIGGERRLTEQEIPELEGWRGSRPVRVGNAATGQLQLDVYGELLNQAWRWFERGHSPDDDYWRFLHELVDAAVARWEEPDCGLWEWRGRPRHFVHSKVMCWVAVDRGLRLAEAGMRKAPTTRWRRARKAIREAVEERGVDRRRGCFVQAFDHGNLDAALLLLPVVDFVGYDDERMVATVDAIREDLSDDGLLRRYSDDELEGREGAFVACSFWLAECLAHQNRQEEAREVFDRAYATANDVGLFSEEFDPGRGEMLGNFPQALSHLAHLTAARACQSADRPA